MGSPGAERTNLQAVLDAILAISSDLDLHSVLNRVVDSCCAVTGAQTGFLGVLGEHGDLVTHVVHGLSGEQAKTLVAQPMRRGFFGHLMRHPEPIRLARIADAVTVGDLPAGLTERDSFLGVPLKVGDTVFGTLCLAHKADGQEFSSRDEDLVEGLARVAGVAVNNARAYALSERRREWVEATAQVIGSLHPPYRIEDTLHQIVLGIRRVARATLAAVVHGRAGGYDVPVADGPGFAVLPQVVQDHDGDIARAQRSGELVVAAYGDQGTVMFAPLDSELSYQGVMVVVIEGGDGHLSFDERELVASYAAQASLALDRAQALKLRQAEALVADRDRIARDLHDLVIQRLFATGLQLQGARRLNDPAELHARLDTAVKDLDQTIRDIRSTIFELEHGQNDTLRNNVALLVREYESALGFSPTLRTSGAIDSLVDRELAGQVLATLREALSNVARHAHARSCVVELHVDPEQLLLIVVDDGQGTGEDPHESGLRNLRRRAEGRGGAMRLDPAHPRGTRLEWRVPTGA